MVVDREVPELRLREAKGQRLRQSMLRDDPSTLTVRLAWGLGDVLLSTSAVHEYKRLHPETRIVYQTYLHNKGARYELEYKKGNPGELLRHNPDIDELADWTEAAAAPDVNFHYAHFGGEPLDYSIQAHFWENLGLKWGPLQRFDSYYHLQPEEAAWAADFLPGHFHASATGPYLVVTPRVGWAGKSWHDREWRHLIIETLAWGWRPIILAGERVDWHMAGVANLSGQLDMRQTGAVLALADRAVMTEGGLSNLRFALGKPVILLTCATQVGVQIWAPPELTTEIRAWRAPNGRTYYGTNPLREGDAPPACEPCMWRRSHVLYQRTDVPPASIQNCPADKTTLRDIPAEVVISILERQR